MADDIPFGEFLPDFPDLKNPGCVTADNVIPRPGGYGPQYGLLTQSQEVLGPIRGARLGFGTSAATVLGGTNVRLFKMVGGVTTVTAVSSAVNTGEYWDFCQFNNIVVATSSANSPYYLDDINTDVIWSGLPGSPPKARYCERVGDFLMLGNIEDQPQRIQWSPFNSPGGTWGVARLTQAGYADMPKDFGAVQRIVGGRYPLVFQERGVNRLEYIGPPQVWRRTPIEQARGCIAPFSVVTVGFVTYYLSQDGFWQTDGNSFEPIGGSRINRWFFDNADVATLPGVHGSIDFENECVVWAFMSRSSRYNRLLRYSWSENRWSTGSVVVDRLVEAVTGGLTLEQLGALYPVLEDVPASLDHPRWRGRNRALAGFVDGATQTEFFTFTGDTLESVLETGEWQPVPARRVTTKRGKVLGAGGQNWQVAAVAIGNDRVEHYGDYTAPMEGGWAAMRADGMTARVLAKAPAGAVWTDVQGVQVDHRPSGGR